MRLIKSSQLKVWASIWVMDDSRRLSLNIATNLRSSDKSIPGTKHVVQKKHNPEFDATEVRNQDKTG